MLGTFRIPCASGEKYQKTWKCDPMGTSTNSSTAWESRISALGSPSCVIFSKLLNFSELRSHYLKTEIISVDS